MMRQCYDAGLKQNETMVMCILEWSSSKTTNTVRKVSVVIDSPKLTWKTIIQIVTEQEIVQIFILRLPICNVCRTKLHSAWYLTLAFMQLELVDVHAAYSTWDWSLTSIRAGQTGYVIHLAKACQDPFPVFTKVVKTRLYSNLIIFSLPMAIAVREWQLKNILRITNYFGVPKTSTCPHVL